MIEYESGLEGSAESDKRDYSEEDVRRWEKKWRKFHRSLPDIVADRVGVRLYKQDKDSGLYMLTPPNRPLRKRRWYWPFWSV